MVECHIESSQVLEIGKKDFCTISPTTAAAAKVVDGESKRINRDDGTTKMLWNIINFKIKRVITFFTYSTVDIEYQSQRNQ